MPKQSKIGSSSSRPMPAVQNTRRPDKFYCTRCPREFDKQRINFPSAQSPLYKANNGYLPVCRHCIEEMYRHYKNVLGDERVAIRRMCMKFDVYWSDRIFDMVAKTSTSTSRILAYISKSNLHQFAEKTYDDTIDEEEALEAKLAFADPDNDTEEIIIPNEVTEFWGSGFAPSFYLELERRYVYWCGTSDKTSTDMDVSERALIKQICMLEATISRDSAEKKPIDKSVNMLNTLLGSMNLKPIQKASKEAVDSNMEATPFGVWIRKIEDTRPISEPDPEFKDVDGIIKYITVWFFGHLCKAMKIENKYSALYEEEMARLRVERPEYEGESEEAMFEDIFERAKASSHETTWDDDDDDFQRADDDGAE